MRFLSFSLNFNRNENIFVKKILNERISLKVHFNLNEINNFFFFYKKSDLEKYFVVINYCEIIIFISYKFLYAY